MPNSPSQFETGGFATQTQNITPTPRNITAQTTILQDKYTVDTTRVVGVILYLLLILWVSWGILSFKGRFALPQTPVNAEFVNYVLWPAHELIQIIGVIPILYFLLVYSWQLLPYFWKNGVWFITCFETTPWQLVVRFIIKPASILATLVILSVYEFLFGLDIIYTSREIDINMVRLSLVNLNTFHPIQEIIVKGGEIISIQSYFGGNIGLFFIDLLTIDFTYINVGSSSLKVPSPNRALWVWSLLTFLYILIVLSAKGYPIAYFFAKVSTLAEKKKLKHDLLPQLKSVVVNTMDLVKQKSPIVDEKTSPTQVVIPEQAKTVQVKNNRLDVLESVLGEVKITRQDAGPRNLIYSLSQAIHSPEKFILKLEQELAEFFFEQNPKYPIPEYKPHCKVYLFRGKHSLLIDKFPTEIKPVGMTEIFKKCVEEMQALKSPTPPILLGLDANGGLQLSSLKEVQHMIRQGLSGSGKGNAYLQILPTLFLIPPKNLKLMVLDVKADMYGWFNQTPLIPHLIHNKKQLIATDRKEILKLLLEIKCLIEKRHKEVSDAGKNNVFELKKSKMVILVFIPELTRLFDIEFQEKTAKLIPKIKKLIDGFLGVARSAGVFFHLDTQEGTKKNTLENVSQCGVKVSFKTKYPASTFLGVGKKQAPTDELVYPGDFYMRNHTNNIIRGYTVLTNTQKDEHKKILKLIVKRWKNAK